MKPLGRKPQHSAEGHQNCAICHPETKGGKALERRRVERDIAEEADPLYPTAPAPRLPSEAGR